MPNYNCLEIPKVLIYQQDLNDSLQDQAILDLFSDLAKQLPPNPELTQYLQLNNPKRQQQRQLNLLLLHQLLTLIGREDLWQFFNLNQHNRPCFTTNSDVKIDFNLSHSSSNFSANPPANSKSKAQKSTAVAIGLDWIGLDIEMKNARQRDYIALAERFCSPDELDLLKNSANLELDFFYLWTLREAVLKTNGFGIDRLRSLKHDFQHITCEFAPNNGVVAFNSELDFYLSLAVPQAKFPKNQQNRWQFFSFNPQNSTIKPIENLHFTTLKLN